MEKRSEFHSVIHDEVIGGEHYHRGQNPNDSAKYNRIVFCFSYVFHLQE